MKAYKDAIAVNGWGLAIEWRGGLYKFMSLNLWCSDAIAEFSRREDVAAVLTGHSVSEVLHTDAADFYAL